MTEQNPMMNRAVYYLLVCQTLNFSTEKVKSGILQSASTLLPPFEKEIAQQFSIGVCS